MVMHTPHTNSCMHNVQEGRVVVDMGTEVKKLMIVYYLFAPYGRCRYRGNLSTLCEIHPDDLFFIYGPLAGL